MATMRVVQIPRPKGPFEIVERQIPGPGAGAVRVRVQACGVCHSDYLVKEGVIPGTIDSQDTLVFSVRNGVRSMNETFPLERTAEAYDRMMSGEARFRVVLKVSEK